MHSEAEFYPESKHTPRPFTSDRLTVVFLCFGNACRSQMAEGYARKLGIDWWEPRSAGLHPLGYIPEEVVEVMAERGISLDGQHSKGVEELDWQQVSVLVDMSGLPGGVPEFEGRRIHWGIPDPFQGPLEEYRQVRDLVAGEVDSLVEMLKRERRGSSGTPIPS